MKKIKDFIKNSRNQSELYAINIQGNDIKDQGFKEIVDGVLERFQTVDHEESFKMPLGELNVRNCQIGENGFKYFIQKFEMIKSKIQDS